MDDDYPNVTAWYTNEPIFNVLDWSHAPGNFVPFQPSPTNYQNAGEGPGWNVRSAKFQNVSQALMDQVFAAAAGGTDQVASLWGHLPEFEPDEHRQGVRYGACGGLQVSGCPFSCRFRR